MANFEDREATRKPSTLDGNPQINIQGFDKGSKMQCSCGGETRLQSHVITTSQSKIDWMGADYNLPVRVERDVCTSCGRHDARFFDDTTGVRLNLKNNN